MGGRHFIPISRNYSFSFPSDTSAYNEPLVRICFLFINLLPLQGEMILLCPIFATSNATLSLPQLWTFPKPARLSLPPGWHLSCLQREDTEWYLTMLRKKTMSCLTHKAPGPPRTSSRWRYLGATSLSLWQSPALLEIRCISCTCLGDNWYCNLSPLAPEHICDGSADLGVKLPCTLHCFP